MLSREETLAFFAPHVQINDTQDEKSSTPNFHEVVEEDPSQLIRLVYSLRQVAKHFNRTISTVQTWMDEGAPRMARGSRWAYDLDAIEEWKRNRPRDPESFATDGPKKNGDGGEGPRQTARDTALESRRRAQAEAEAIKVKLLRAKYEQTAGTMIPKEDVLRFMSQFFIYVRSHLLKIPAARKPSWPQEHADYLEEDLTDALETFLRGVKLFFMAEAREQIGVEGVDDGRNHGTDLV